MKNTKSDRKLSLATETLARLTPELLDQVVGGLGAPNTTRFSCLYQSCGTSPPAK